MKSVDQKIDFSARTCVKEAKTGMDFSPEIVKITRKLQKRIRLSVKILKIFRENDRGRSLEIEIS